VNPVLALNAGLLAIAVCAASYFPKDERGGAVMCAAILFPIWAVYTLSFSRQFNIPLAVSPYADISSSDVWAFMDLVGGIVALLVWRFWWAKALWATFLVETILHVVRWGWGAIDRQAYYHSLDSIFYAQIALFLVGGGRGVVEYITAGIDSCRAFLRVHHRVGASSQELTRV
jgi:hypothetical protein